MAGAWRTFKNAQRLEGEWDRLRRGEGPTINELADTGVKLGLSAGDSGVVAVLALNWWDSIDDPDAVLFVEGVDKYVQRGEVGTVTGQAMADVVPPGAAGVLSALVLLLVRLEGEDRRPLRDWVRRQTGT